MTDSSCDPFATVAISGVAAVLFRGVVFGWLRRWPLPIAVIVSALIYHRSGSIWPAVVLHAVATRSAAAGSARAA